LIEIKIEIVIEILIEIKIVILTEKEIVMEIEIVGKSTIDHFEMIFVTIN